MCSMTDVQQSPDDRPQLTKLSNWEFGIVFAFKIEDLVTTELEHNFTAMASYRKQPVGVRVAVRRGIRGFFENLLMMKESIYRAIVRFDSIGEPSDRLLEAMAKTYGVECPEPKMIEFLECTGLLLEGDIDSDGPAKIKLTGQYEPTPSDDEEEKDYFELFFYIDLGVGVVLLTEKDSNYRGALIRSLTAADPEHG